MKQSVIGFSDIKDFVGRMCECVMQCPCIMLFNFWNQSTQSALIRRYCAVISKCMYNGSLLNYVQFSFSFKFPHGAFPIIY